MKFQRVGKDHNGDRLATPAEVRAHHQEVMCLLEKWTMALLDGGKVNGCGHGGDIQEGDFVQECGEKIIVVSESGCLPTLLILTSSGAAGQKYSSLMGAYQWKPTQGNLETNRNYPVYRRMEGEGALYVDSYGNWVVGEDLDTARMYSSKRPVLISPPQDEWYYYDAGFQGGPEGQWKEDSNMCIAAGMHIPEVKPPVF